MAKISFLLQGIKDNNDHEAAIRALLSDPKFSGFIVSVAFLKESGVTPLADVIKKHASRIAFFVGIRNNITSSQGLLTLLKLTPEVYVVDTAAAAHIFHPKIYIALTEKFARVIIGSANMTGGGFNRNIEGSAVIDIDRNVHEDEEFLKDLLLTHSKLKTDYPKNVFKITPAVVETLLKEGRLEDEDYTPVRRGTKTVPGTERDTTPKMKLFYKRATIKIRKAPKGTVTAKILGSKHLIWVSKELTERDLNIPSSADTHSTGSMLFKKGQSEDIDQRHYFRDVVFSALPWQKDVKHPHLERAEAEFEIRVKGVSHGVHKLKLTHNSSKTSKAYQQNNAMTQIHWGDAKGFIAKRDLLERELKLHKVIGNPNQFILEID